MSKEKPSNFLNLEKYCFDNYGLDWYNFFTHLEEFANYKSILVDDNRDFLLSSFGYNEVALGMDTYYDMIRMSLRKKDGYFLLDEGLAFLRFYRLLNMLEHELVFAPNYDKEGFRNFCLNHPLWQRLEEQALRALELFKKNKNSRTQCVSYSS